MDANWDIPQDIQLLVPLLHAPYDPHDLHDQTKLLLYAQWHGLKSLRNGCLLPHVLHVFVSFFYVRVLLWHERLF